MKHEQLNARSKFLPWILFGTITMLPLIAWLDRLNWSIDEVAAFSIFPILGLLAWGIMWTHYAIGALRLTFPALQKNYLYTSITTWLVLLLILAHPGILAWNLWKFTSELPPGSYYNYVGSSLKLFVIFGSISLLIFLSFDVFERMKNKTWVKHNWRYISLMQMLAMTLIFLHALALGKILDIWWLELYWVTLGALLIPCFAIIGRHDWKQT